MQKNMYFDFFGKDCFGAVAEDGRLVEFHLDSDSASEISGNIYKGRVVNVLDGMQAAFVAFGREKNGYLYAGDIPCAAEIGQSAAEQKLNVRVGQEVMVQVSKSPIGTKGARLSMNLSFVGKNLIFLPTADFCAISRKITDEGMRARMEEWLEKLRADGGGFIMRTNAQSRTLKELRHEEKYLRELYNATRAAYENACVGDMIYRSEDVHARLLRDFDLDSIDKVYIGNREAYARVEEMLRKTRYRCKAELYTGTREMFDHFGLEQQIYELMSPRVALESGAYLVFDKTEALTAIDVNTGKFTGETGLEDTVYRTNLLAAREIARQVRLRNIGGIVVVDFIDMESAEHRAAVVEELEKYLREDRAKCNVSAMTELGLVQFTRKKVKTDNVSMLTKSCPYCKGSGIVLSDSYIAFRIQIALKRLFADGYENAIVELNAGIYACIVGKRLFSKLVRGEWRDKRVYMIPHRTFHDEYFVVRGDNNPVLTLPDTAKLLY